jgi:Cu+-exporting ATPase
MDSERSERIRYFGFAAFVGALLLLYVLGYFKTLFGIDIAAIIAVLAGYRIFFNSISALLEKTISADLAICVAVIAALIVGEYAAAAEAMFIMLVGEGIESYAAGRTSAAIERFVEQMPRLARLLRDGHETEVDAESLVAGDIIVVRAGERLAADGVVVHGHSSIDESTITGESLPREKEPGQEVFSGTLNGAGLLRIRVTRAGAETTLSRVVALMEEAKKQRAPVERLADRYARYFLPALLIAAALTFYFTRDWSRTIAVLIVACPCALILATPTAMVAAIGGLARRGILVRGGTVLQQAAKVDTVVFDKTGTITEGRFEIVAVVGRESGSPLGESGSQGVRESGSRTDEDQLLVLAAAAGSGSGHALSKVILEEVKRRGLKLPAVDGAHIVPGRGAECRLHNRTIRAGSAAFLAEHGITETAALIEEADRLGATAVLVAEDDQLAGAILLRDRLRAGVKEAVEGLKALDITYQVMLTGDRRRAAEAIAREAGIPNVEAELLPEQKVDRVKQLASQGRFVAMVGDGVNDAPALATAHVGIAVAGASDITAEAAGVVYLGHSLEKLPKFFAVSRRAVATAWQNIFLFAGVVNIAAVWLAATGVLTPIGAAFTHQLSSFFVMINSLRLLRVERTGAGRWSRLLGRMHIAGAWTQVRRLAATLDIRVGFAYLVERRRQLARPVAYAAIALLMWSGLYTIRPDEIGVIERFGQKILPFREPGLHYKLPWPIERLTRIQPRKSRVVEVGFRSAAATPDAEPAAYEWNVQHRSGRFQKKPEESLMLAGDQNMMEVNAVVHFRIARPDDFLFLQLDGDATVRTACESALTTVASTTSLDDILTVGRKHVESRVRAEIQSHLDRYHAGVEVLRVQLLDVHPSLEVVDAFREVSGAYEEKNRLINEAEAYRNQQVALARGNAKATLAAAEGYSLGRKNRSAGDASRFTEFEAAYRANAGLNDTRLYLETMEQVLPGKKKVIVDSGKGHRSLFLVDDGVMFAPSGPGIGAPQFRNPDQ